MTRDDTHARWARDHVGKVVRGKYTLDAVLGVGGMAVVFRATHRNRHEFALKMLLPELSRDRDVLARFLREGYAANSVKHPGAVRVLDDDVAEDGAAYVVMELLDGVSVEELCERAGGTLPIPIAVALGVQLLDVLAAAHEAGVVHRDVKPGNLFVTRDGQVKVLDFGIARVRALVASGGPTATQSGVTMGTPAFMSPEQAMGKSDLDGQADVWAAGATLFTLISGALVHDAETPAQLVVHAATRSARSLAMAEHVPIQLTSTVDRALAFDKDARWASAAEMRDALVEGYRAAYGAPPPGAAELAAACASVARDTRPDVGTGPSRVEHGATTAAPMVTEDRKAGPRRTGALVVALAGGGALVVGAALLLLARAHAPTTAASASATSTSASGVEAPPALPSASAPVAVTSASTGPAEAPPTASASVAPAASTARVPSTARPAPTSRSGAPTSNCKPPYTLDADGNKHFKPECFAQ